MKDITISEIHELIELNEKDKEFSLDIMNSRGKDSFNPYPNGFDRLSFYGEVFSDMYMNGFAMRCPHGTVIRQAQRSYYYRGEDEVFPTSQSTLERYLSSTEDNEERLLIEFVSSLRFFEFTRLINSFEHIKKFEEKGITILYENIAQHYGIKTRWLDITNDFDVALFFACCKYVDNKWMPLTDYDINRKDESKYGVIFRKASNHFTNFLPPEVIKYEVLPVGYQPFMRCSMQTAYSIHMDDDADLQKSDFEILRFRQSEKLSNFIFDRMAKGLKVYPHEDLSLIFEQVDLINKTVEFSREVFEIAAENFPELTKQQWSQKLENHGYRIGFTPITLTNEDILRLNDLYKDFTIEEFYKIDMRTRPLYRPGDEENHML